MTRMEEAKELKRQGFKLNEIAEKMGIKVTTALYYVYRTEEKDKQYSRTKVMKEVRLMINKELRNFNLPLVWEDELARMFLVYHYSKARTGSGQGLHFKLDVLSLIQLLCRKYKVPTPRKLEILTAQGAGATRLKSGYIDVLQRINGVVLSKPLDYVTYFVNKEELPSEVIKEAEKLIKKIPLQYLQSRNPRVLAAAILYEIFKPETPTVGQNRIYTQRYIADKLSVTAAALRYNWIRFFKR